MSETITLKQYDGQIVTPKDDALLYDLIVGRSGLISGCELTDLGAGKIRISAGRGIIKGRMFEVLENTINVTLAEEGTLPGRLYLHMDLSDAESPIRILHETADVLAELVCEEDCNETAGIYEIELGTYTANVLQIVELRRTADVIEESKGDMANVRYNEDTDYIEVLKDTEWVQTNYKIGLGKEYLFTPNNNAGKFSAFVGSGYGYAGSLSYTTLTAGETLLFKNDTRSSGGGYSAAVGSVAYDVTGYNKLVIDCKASREKGDVYNRAFIFLSATRSTTMTPMCTIDLLTGSSLSEEKKIEIDISKITGEVYVVMETVSNVAVTTISVKEMYFE